MNRNILGNLMISSLIVIVIIGLWSLIHGSMFSERCARVYPDSILKQEKCVFNLDHSRQLDDGMQ